MMIPAGVLLAFWFILQAFSGVASLGIRGGGVAWFAHIGGFLGGMFMIFLMEGGRVYWLRRGNK